MKLPIDTPLANATSMESSGYWGQPSYTAQEIAESQVIITFVRTQVVSAFGEQLGTNAKLTSLGLNDQSRSINAIRFNPAFPASCSYVVSVGATQINSGTTVNDPESACSRRILSGGGFSDIFSMPSYQTAAVTNFLEEHPPPYSAAQFNNSGKVALIQFCGWRADKSSLRGTRLPRLVR